MMAFDDGNREVLGVANSDGSDFDVLALEGTKDIRIKVGGNYRDISVARARFIARSLHRLARRIEARNAP